ncbi:MAG: zinc-binding dehydrogenase [Egibacteraceae bacterium]
MLAVTAASLSLDDPLSGLHIAQCPDATPPRTGWEVVQVKAASLNHHDLWSLRGVGLKPDRLPMILGCDAAGITADGREVVVHAVIAGDGNGPETPGAPFSLFSEGYPGTHAELLAAPAVNLVDKPPELSFAEAACLPTAWLTAFRMLFVQGDLHPGQRVLIQGAGGGVSTAAIMLARAAGLGVYVTSRSPDKRNRAVDLGAHEAFEPGAHLPERVDGVLETVGQATWHHSLRSVQPGGVIVCAGATSGPNPPADLRRVFYRQLRIVGSTMGTRRELIQLIRMLGATGIRPVIDAMYPLTEAYAAYRQMESGELFGKIVLTPGGA